MSTLHSAIFSLPRSACPENVQTVGILGTFCFYESHLTGNTCETGMGGDPEFLSPEDYRDGLQPIGMRMYREMRYVPEKDAYEIEFQLPAGAYMYRFALNAVVEDGEIDFRSGKQICVGSDGKLHPLSQDTIYLADPACPPRYPTVTGQQADSMRYIGTGADAAWLPPVEGVKRGTVTYMSYEDVDGLPQSLGVYLPPDYDRTKTYPAVYVSHGGGGCETDWFFAAGIDHIMDNLIAEGRTRDAILITMNNSVYSWDFEKIAKNLYEKIIPFAERVLNISKDPSLNAFCGLSMGSMTTLYMYMHHNTHFKYFGAFSGGIAGGEHFSLEDEHLKDLKLLIGCAEKDIAWNFREIGVPPTIEQLKKKGLPFTSYFVPGAHDWYCWSQMYTHFAAEYLWK